MLLAIGLSWDMAQHNPLEEGIVEQFLAQQDATSIAELNLDRPELNPDSDFLRGLFGLVADFTPGIGDAKAAFFDAPRQFEAGENVGGVVSVLSALPGVGLFGDLIRAFTKRRRVSRAVPRAEDVIESVEEAVLRRSQGRSARQAAQTAASGTARGLADEFANVVARLTKPIETGGLNRGSFDIINEAGEKLPAHVSTFLRFDDFLNISIASGGQATGRVGARVVRRIGREVIEAYEAAGFTVKGIRGTRVDMSGQGRFGNRPTAVIPRSFFFPGE